MIEEIRSKTSRSKNVIDISISVVFDIYICKNVFFDLMSVKGKNQN